MSPASPMVRRDLRAMNSDIELVCCVPDANRRLLRATAWLVAFEARYSRFRVLSELSRLNASAGLPFHASAGLYHLVSLALDFARRTDGLFDPTVLSQLVAAGYDRSFELLQAGAVAGIQPAGARSSWRDVVLDREARTILLPQGCGIDLGGIGKGVAVDLLSKILGTPSMVNGGGDVLVAGSPSDDAVWRVGVADPFTPDRDIALLGVVDRGIATSSSLKRSWRSGDLTLHHLIDPRTGRPSESDAVQVTVVASTALLADVHAKVALLHGVDAGLAYLTLQPDVEGLLVGADGAQAPTLGWRQYISPKAGGWSGDMRVEPT